MNFENYGIGFIDITGVIMFLAIKYGHKKESPVPYYKRKDLKFKDYGKKRRNCCY